MNAENIKITIDDEASGKIKMMVGDEPIYMDAKQINQLIHNLLRVLYDSKKFSFLTKRIQFIEKQYQTL